MAKFSKKPSAISSDSRLRRHTPLVVWFSVGMVLLVLVLPSALNLPQANPTTISEYAPVPPDDSSAPPGGNLSSLGLSSSKGLGSGVGGSEDSGLLGGAGKGRKVSSKRCVGNPARQTSDPMSPPCVAHFEGNNGGATAKGVTKDEVIILVYIAAIPIGLGVGCHQEGCDVDEYYDLGKPATESNEGGHDEAEAGWPQVWRRWQNYFNDRYQTYDRFVHLWVHFGSEDDSEAARRADVADAAAKLDPGPFAVITDIATNAQPYAEEWARRGKAVFMSSTSRLAEVGYDQNFLSKYPGQLWSYVPSIQQMSNNYGNLICAQLVPHPVSFSGDVTGSGRNGQPRKFGLLRSNNPNEKNRIEYGALIRKRLEGCGATIADEQYNKRETNDNISANGPPPGHTPEAQVQMATMRQRGVTTIIYALGAIYGYSQAIAHQQPPWRPELLVQMENLIAIPLYEDPDVMQHARNSSVWPRATRPADRPCQDAYNEARQSSGNVGWAQCYTFNDARMLFTGIQVAGPRLTVKNMDVGFHRIPAIPNGDPKVPACFFEAGDTTCVKDAQTQWWDPAGQMSGASQKGCWRSMEDGMRYLSHAYPLRDLDSVRNSATDGCNFQSGAF